MVAPYQLKEALMIWTCSFNTDKQKLIKKKHLHKLDILQWKVDETLFYFN